MNNRTFNKPINNFDENNWKDRYKNKSNNFNTLYWLTNLIGEEFSEVIGGCSINFKQSHKIIDNIQENNNLKDLLFKLIKNSFITSSSAIFFYKIDDNIILDIPNSIFKWSMIGNKLLSITLITNIIKGTSPSIEIIGCENQKIWKSIIKTKKMIDKDDYTFLPIEEQEINIFDTYKDVIPCVIWFWNCDQSDNFSKIPPKLFDMCNDIFYQINEEIFYSSSKLYVSLLTLGDGRKPKVIEEKYKYSKVIMLDKPNAMTLNPYNYVIGDLQVPQFTNALNYLMTLIRSIFRANKPLSAGGTHNKHTTEVLMENINYYNNIINIRDRLEKLLNDLFKKIFKSYSNDNFEGLTLKFNPIIQTQIDGIGNTKVKTNVL